FGHRLAQASESVADWREDLRILYVACTRARDLLVLSAGLAAPFPAGAPRHPPGPGKAADRWELAPRRRFSLGTGECLDRSIPADLRPRVAVNVIEPSPGAPTRSGRREEEAIPQIRPDRIAPVPPAPWPAVVDLAVLESRGEPSAVTAAFRQALRRWDLTDDGRSRFAELPAEAAALLDRFAASEWPARLRRAERLLRDVEFLSPWPVSGADRPALRGRIDSVWNEAGRWHVLALDAGEGRSWTGRVLEAWVVGEQFGAPVESV